MKRIGISLVFLGVLSGAVDAAVLYAGPIAPGIDGRLLCRIANVSNRTHDVIIDIIDGTGAPTTPNPQTLAPLASAGSFYIEGFNGQNPRLCRFTVEGGKGDYRTSACAAVDNDFVPIACVSGD